MNPMQLVPAFVVDGATLTQSVSISIRERERETFTWCMSVREGWIVDAGEY